MRDFAKYLNRFALALALLGVVTGGTLLAYRHFAGPSVRPAVVTRSTGTAQVGGAFTLLDHTGRTVSDTDFGDDFLLIYFGYTTCPDVCPTALLVMTQALDELGPQGERVRPLFITIDPERDTQEVMADYVAHFHPRLVGLTGSPEQVAVAAKAYLVYYAKARLLETENAANQNAADDDYLMDHSGFIYLMGRDRDLSALFRPDTDVQEMAAKIRGQLNAEAGGGGQS